MADAFPRCDVPEDFGDLPAIDLSNAINDDTIPDPGDPIREGGGGVGGVGSATPTLGVVSPTFQTPSTSSSPTTYIATLTSCLIKGGSASFFSPGFGSGTAGDWVLAEGQVMLSGSNVTVVSMGGSMWITGGPATTGGCVECYTLSPCISGDILYASNDLAAMSDKPPDQLQSEGWVYEVQGKCYTVSGYGNNCDDAQEYDISKGFDSCEFCGCFKLTETCVGSAPDVIIASGGTDSDDEAVTLRDLIGKVVRLGGGSSGKLYTVESWDECESASDVTVQESYDNCDDAMCFEMTDCDGVSASVVTFTDFYGLGYVIGQVFKNGNKCYTLASETAWTVDAVDMTPGGDPFVDCTACPSDTNPLKFRLTAGGCTRPECDQEDAADDIVTGTDMSAALGGFVKVGGICYSVGTAAEDEPDAGTMGDFQGPFDSCDECKAEPVSGTSTVWGKISQCGNAICQEKQKVITADGLIVGFCNSGSEVVITGGTC